MLAIVGIVLVIPTLWFWARGNAFAACVVFAALFLLYGPGAWPHWDWSQTWCQRTIGLLALIAGMPWAGWRIWRAHLAEKASRGLGVTFNDSGRS